MGKTKEWCPTHKCAKSHCDKCDFTDCIKSVAELVWEWLPELNPDNKEFHLQGSCDVRYKPENELPLFYTSYGVPVGCQFCYTHKKFLGP